jgi:hypothetical protein
MLGGGSTERERQDIIRLGARLADSEGFRVIALDGRDVGALDHVRYARHMDHPDEVVIKRRVFLWDRRATVSFEDVANVDPDRERVYLSVPHSSIDWAQSQGT